MAMVTATPSLIRMPSKSLTRENSVLLNHQIRLAEENADLHKDIEYILSFLEGSDPTPDTYVPQLNNANPSNEPWFQTGLQRSHSVSSSRAILLLEDLSHITPAKRADELAKHAFRPTAPAVDMPTIPEETVVTMRDLEFHPQEEAEEVGERLWVQKASGSGKALLRKGSIGPLLKAWLGTLHEADESQNTEPPSKEPAVQEVVFIPSPESSPSRVSFYQPPSPEKRPKKVSPIRVPTPLPVPHISPQPSRQSSPSPSIYTVDSGDDDDDDYMPSFSPGKRTRRSHVMGKNVSSDKSTSESPCKRTRVIPAPATQLFCLYVDCPNATLVFTNLRDRNRHMETHFPDREHPKCAACGKSMSRSDSVKRHQNSAAGRKCRVALNGKPGSTMPSKPWCKVEPWKGVLKMPPEDDPLYSVALEMKTKARR